MFRLYNSKCQDVLDELDENSVTAVITDPPYGLGKQPKDAVVECLKAWLSGKEYVASGCGFMGKDWDSWVPGPDIWKKVFRVLKPGGFAFVFAGTRTADLMGIALRLAGFEVRDMLAWHYAQGFPKSTNISKQIDKQYGKLLGGQSVVQLKNRLIDLFDRSGKTRNQIDAECGFRASNYLSLPDADKRFDPWVNILPSQEKWQKIKSVLACVEDVSQELDAWFISADQEIVGQDTKARNTSSKVALPTMGGATIYESWDITKSITGEGIQWAGYGTALKPAFEPIIVAMKPVEGTYVQNAIKHGVAGLNIDGGRIATIDTYSYPNGPGGKSCHWAADSKRSDEVRPAATKNHCAGRWPANFVLSHSKGCKMIGTVKVKGNGSDDDIRGSGGMWSGESNKPCGPQYADEDGNETVEQWDCVDGCPVKELAKQSGEKTSTRHMSYKRSGNGFIGSVQNMPECDWFVQDKGNASRFFYCAKCSPREGEQGLVGKVPCVVCGRLDSINHIDPRTNKEHNCVRNNHPTKKPIKLMEYLCKLLKMPKDNVVLDPFMGSGTTGIASINNKMDFIGIEMEKQSFEIAKARIESAEEQQKPLKGQLL